jgi:hypothetical protein
LRGIVSDPSVGIGCSRIWEAYEKLKLNSCHNHRVAYYLTEQLVGRARQRQRNKHVDGLQLASEYPVLTRKHKTVAQKNMTTQPFPVSLAPHSNSVLYRDWHVRYNENNKQSFPFSFVTELQLGGENKLSYEIKDVSQLPLQMNQPLIGGEQFFLFIAKYVELYKQLFPSDIVVEEYKDDTVKAQGMDFIQERLLKKHRHLECQQGLGYPRLIQTWQALIIFYVDRFGQDDNFAAFVRLSDQYIFSLRILLYQVKRASVEKKLLEAGVFSHLLQMATSCEAVAFIERLIELRAKDKELVTRLSNDVKGVRKKYIDYFYWHKGESIDGYLELQNGLSRLLKKHHPAQKSNHKELADA